MSGHTTGPWGVKYDEFDGAFHVTPGLEPLEIGEWSPICVLGSYDDDEEANAHLLAAAPEMLEALEEARVQVAILQECLGIEDTGSGTLSIIDAAIAKARGQS